MRSRSVAAWITVLALVALGPLPSAEAATRPPVRSAPVCPPVTPGSALCDALVVTDAKGVPLATAGPVGFGPDQFHGAYGLPTLSGLVPPPTIAIVDAYDAPKAKADLDTYDATFGLPFFPNCSATVTTSCFLKVNQSGQASPLPRSNSNWALEIALDVQIAHALCQDCTLLLVEAKTNKNSDLAAAVNTAVALGASVVSNSYGGPETSTTFGGAYDHAGVAIVASAGNGGFGVQSPASYPTVVSVGGTHLTVNADNSYGGESVWSRSGSGCSAFFSAPAWQTSLANWADTGCGTMRAMNDLAADADPASGAAIYDSTKYQGQSGWFELGGTSLAAPIVASAFALAGNAGSASYPASLAYANPAALHDVSTGNNGACGTIMCNAGVGYDGPSGLGSPNGLGAF